MLGESIFDSLKFFARLSKNDFPVFDPPHTSACLAQPLACRVEETYFFEFPPLKVSV
ncbi:MAG: hypothetical protein CM1200mP3_17660 [Chloroflexota bacterium]|nr:MAG: hypothetical protein CM1200mP3_17660 [Chloroflexota bacterium]